MQSAQTSALGTFAFSPYAAGKKIYGQVSSSPTMGPVDKTGYAARDAKKAARKNAVMQMIKNRNAGAYGAPDSLRMMR